MSGMLPPQDHEMLAHRLESLRLHVQRLYRQSSKRDALEGQRLTVTTGRYTLQFQMDSEVEWGPCEVGAQRAGQAARGPRGLLSSLGGE